MGDRPIVKKVEKKKSVVLQCAVQGTQDIDVQWFKEGQAISASKGARFSVEKKKSEGREGETIVQLEIHDTEITDQGSYQLVAKSETGETQSQTVTLKFMTLRSRIRAATNWLLKVKLEKPSPKLSPCKKSRLRWKQLKPHPNLSLLLQRRQA